MHTRYGAVVRAWTQLAMCLLDGLDLLRQWATGRFWLQMHYCLQAQWYKKLNSQLRPHMRYVPCAVLCRFVPGLNVQPC